VQVQMTPADVALASGHTELAAWLDRAALEQSVYFKEACPKPGSAGGGAQFAAAVTHEHVGARLGAATATQAHGGAQVGPATVTQEHGDAQLVEATGTSEGSGALLGVAAASAEPVAPITRSQLVAPPSSAPLVAASVSAPLLAASVSAPLVAPSASARMEAPAATQIDAADNRTPRLISKHDVFLTYDGDLDEQGRDNHKRVKLVNLSLKAAGIRTWFHEEGMRGDIHTTIARAICDSKVVLVFITNSYVQNASGYGPNRADDRCKFEFDSALLEPHLGSAKMIPVVMEPRCKIPSTWPAGVVKGKLACKTFIDLAEDGPAFNRNIDDKLVAEIRMHTNERLQVLLQSTFGRDVSRRTRTMPMPDKSTGRRHAGELRRCLTPEETKVMAAVVGAAATVVAAVVPVAAACSVQ